MQKSNRRKNLNLFHHVKDIMEEVIYLINLLPNRGVEKVLFNHKGHKGLTQKSQSPDSYRDEI
jgi:hypothetical protein